MNKADGTTAQVDLAGAVSAIALMYELGFGELPESEFWEKRAILERFEASIRKAEREACAALVERAGAFHTKPVCDALAAGIRNRS